MSALSRVASSVILGGRESMLESGLPIVRDPNNDDSDVESEIEDDDNSLVDDDNVEDDNNEDGGDFEPNNYQNDRVDLTPIKGANSKDETDEESNEKAYNAGRAKETDRNIDVDNQEKDGDDEEEEGEDREQLQDEEEDNNAYEAQIHQRGQDNEEQEHSMRSANFAYPQQEQRDHHQFEKQEYMAENNSPFRRGQARDSSGQMNTAQYTRLLMQECGAHQKTRSNTLWEDTKLKNQWEEGKPNKKIVKHATASGVGQNGILPSKASTEKAKKPTVGWNYYYKSNIFAEPKAEESPKYSSPQRETLSYGRSSLNSKQTFHLVGDKVQNNNQEPSPKTFNNTNTTINNYRDRMFNNTKRIY